MYLEVLGLRLTWYCRLSMHSRVNVHLLKKTYLYDAYRPLALVSHFRRGEGENPPLPRGPMSGWGGVSTYPSPEVTCPGGGWLNTHHPP